MAEYVELYMDQGATFSTTINLNDDVTNLAQNLYSYTVTGSMRRSLLSVNATASFVCSVSDYANGEITVSMDASNTANIKAGTYVFDINTLIGTTKSRLLEGVIIVTPSITR